MKNKLLSSFSVRILSVFLALCLCFSTPVLAAEQSGVSVSSPQEAAEQLYRLGLFWGTGTDKDGKPTFELERAPKRAEAMVLIVRLLNKESAAKAGSWSTPFTDVPEWAAKHIGYAYANGLTNGVSSTRFGSDEPVTAEQYLAFLLRALDYLDGTAFSQELIHQLADQLGITESADETTGVFTRGDAVLLSLRALNCTVKGSDQTLLSRIEGGSGEPADTALSEEDPTTLFSAAGQPVTLRFSPGSTENYTFSYQWYTADSEGTALSAIGGAVSNTYTTPAFPEPAVHYYLCKALCTSADGQLPETLTSRLYRVTYTGLPQICIDTDGEELTADYSNCSISVVSEEEAQSFCDASAKIKVRGNSTADYAKKPYRLKFNSKTPMLGLNDGLKAKSWVLLAEYTDRSLLRNDTAFFLGREILGADGYYVSDCRHVDLFLDGQYEGVYLLAEQQQVDKHRVNICEPETDDTRTDIGYLLEMDRYYREEDPDTTFAINYRSSQLSADLKTAPVFQKRLAEGYVIKSDLYSTDQRDFVHKVVQNIWNILCMAMYENRYYTLDKNGELIPDTESDNARDCIARVVDLTSLVNTFILQELCENIDVGYSSFYLSIDMSDSGSHKLTFQAPWDFDWSLGQGTYTMDRLWTCTSANATIGYQNPWLYIVGDQDWFLHDVSVKWQSLEKSGLIERTNAHIRELTDAYDIAFSSNFDRWPECRTFYISYTSSTVRGLSTQRANAVWLQEYLSYREAFFETFFLPELYAD